MAFVFLNKLSFSSVSKYLSLLLTHLIHVNKLSHAVLLCCCGNVGLRLIDAESYFAAINQKQRKIPSSRVHMFPREVTNGRLEVLWTWWVGSKIYFLDRAKFSISNNLGSLFSSVSLRTLGRRDRKESFGPRLAVPGEGWWRLCEPRTGRGRGGCWNASVCREHRFRKCFCAIPNLLFEREEGDLFGMTNGGIISRR